MVIKLWIFWKKGSNIGGTKHEEIDTNISDSESGSVFLIMDNWSSRIMNDLVFDKPLQARLDREQYYHYKWMFWKEILNRGYSCMEQR